MLTAKDLEKYHQAAERILNAMDNSPVPISWHEMDRMELQSVIAKELILIDKEARKMNVCKVPDMCKDMEYKYITEDSKTRVYLSVVREFNEAEYEKYCIRKKKEKVRKRILFIARALKYALPVLASTILYKMLSNKLYLERGSYEIGSEIVFVGIFGIVLFGFLDWFIGGDEH